MPAAEPRYVRFLRGLLHLTEPDVMDGFLLGMAVALGGGVLFAYWWWSL
jgi:hypothetical protein